MTDAIEQASPASLAFFLKLGHPGDDPFLGGPVVFRGSPRVGPIQGGDRERLRRVVGPVASGLSAGHLLALPLQVAAKGADLPGEAADPAKLLVDQPSLLVVKPGEHGDHFHHRMVVLIEHVLLHHRELIDERADHRLGQAVELGLVDPLGSGRDGEGCRRFEGKRSDHPGEQGGQVLRGGGLSDDGRPFELGAEGKGGGFSEDHESRAAHAQARTVLQGGPSPGSCVDLDPASSHEVDDPELGSETDQDAVGAGEAGVSEPEVTLGAAPDGGEGPVDPVPIASRIGIGIGAVERFEDEVGIRPDRRQRAGGPITHLAGHALARQADPERADLDRSIGFDPSGSSGASIPAEGRTAAEVEAVDPFADQLQEGVPSADLGVVEDEIGRRIAADDREREWQVMLDRLTSCPVPDEQAEGRGGTGRSPETVKASVYHGAAPRISVGSEGNRLILSH